MSTSGKQQLPPLAIAMFPCDSFGCGYYRMRLPGMVLSEVGGHAVHVYDGYEFPNPQERPYDIYHFQRVTTPKGLGALREALKTGKPVLMDLDDDLFNLFPSHPSSWYFRKGKECRRCGNASLPPNAEKCETCGGDDLEYQDRLDICGKGIQEVDVVTVSTPQLGDRFPGAKRIELLPNYINMQKFDSLVRKGDYNIVVGWAGSFTHNLDIAIIRDVVKIIEDYDNVYFAVVGLDPQVIHDSFGDFKDKDRLIMMDPLPVEEYPEILGAFDIGLAPVLDNLFNRCKSELKAEEYGAAKVPYICSDVAPYSRYVEHGKDGFLARKPKEWKRYLRMLIEDSQLRKQMSQTAYEKASTMDIRKNAYRRERLYYELALEKQITPVYVMIQQMQEAEHARQLKEGNQSLPNFGMVGGTDG